MSSRRTETVERLSRELRQREQTRRAAAPGVFSTGIPPLDDLLPDGGLRPGMLVEWLAARSGSGAGTLTLRIAAALSGGVVEEHSFVTPHPGPLPRGESVPKSGLSRGRGRGWAGTCVVVDRQRSWYAPAAAALGLNLAATIVVHPASPRDELWALEQSLRCRGVSVVLAWPGRLRSDDFRRLQLAGEHGGGVGLLLRSARHRREASWADLRLLVEPLPPVNPVLSFLPREPHPRRTDAIAGEGPGVREQQQRFAGSLHPAALSQLTCGRRSPPAMDLQSSVQRWAEKKEVWFENPPGRLLRVELVHCRGRFGGGAVILEIDDETGVVRRVSRVAPAAAVRRAAGA